MTPTILIALLSLALLSVLIINFLLNRENDSLLKRMDELEEENLQLEAQARDDMDEARTVMRGLRFELSNLKTINTEKQTPRAGTARYDPDDNPPLESRFEAKLRKSK